MVVQKPVSRAQTENPRDFQIRQLRRRFSPEEKPDEKGTNLMFKMMPSDPDFPFEMDGLRCNLYVPLSYSKGGKPTLRVSNPEMDRGYQINVERGFDALVAKTPNGTLLSWMNALDRQLESLLVEQKADTIKFVSNAIPGAVPAPSATLNPDAAKSTSANQGLHDAFDTFTAQQNPQAQSRRELELRQLEARLGRMPLFFKSPDGISFILPIQPQKSGDLPVPLQTLKAVKLIVPSIYNLEPCQIEIEGVSRGAAEATERAFERRAREHPDMSLMAHINYLSQNMHSMATQVVENRVETIPNTSSLAVNDRPDPSKTKPSAEAEDADDRSHIQVIPRPPEWAYPSIRDGPDSDDSDLYDSEEEFSEDDEDGGAPVPEVTPISPERGVLLSLPMLELYGIEILELTSLSTTIKCGRCKEVMDVKNVKSNSTGDSSGMRSESCKKCANSLSIGQYYQFQNHATSLADFHGSGYRRELMHANSVRAGYLDLDGCMVVDLLPRFVSLTVDTSGYA